MLPSSNFILFFSPATSLSTACTLDPRVLSSATCQSFHLWTLASLIPLSRIASNSAWVRVQEIFSKVALQLQYYYIISKGSLHSHIYYGVLSNMETDLMSLFKIIHVFNK